ncbi:MAG: DUF167 domain-containing protein [Alphaproteobacteria bacterium]|nr:DUF167 domain-containing protein [Alphaproteobacteria bacterium]
MRSAPLIQATAGGLQLRVRVNPRAGRDRVLGVIELPSGPALKIAVAAPAAEGQANVAVMEFLAKGRGVPKTKISIASSAFGRLKLLQIEGDMEELAAKLDAMIEDA